MILHLPVNLKPGARNVCGLRRALRQVLRAPHRLQRTRGILRLHLRQLAVHRGGHTRLRNPGRAGLRTERMARGGVGGGAPRGPTQVRRHAPRPVLIEAGAVGQRQLQPVLDG